ncbi:MAG TPA: GNAT family N-acetyltransferase [Acidobacteriota bacterium]|jgi:GNAT superfamily N-acetyltransferase
MTRENLDFIPAFDLPPDYFLRWYRPGDERHWVEIQRQADRYNAITPDLFERQFGANKDMLLQRQCFLTDRSGAPIGTATAWFNPDYRGKPYGRVHWVAIVPEMQGRGLSKPLLSAVCNRLRQLGHLRAYLTTAPQRTPAIHLYLKFGFLPEITGPEDAEVWSRLI